MPSSEHKAPDTDQGQGSKGPAAPSGAVAVSEKDKEPAGGQEEQESPRTPARRQRSMAALMTAVVLAGLYSIGQPWYGFKLRHGAVVSTPNGKLIPVSAHATVSAWGLVHPAPLSQLAASASSTALTAASPGSVSGVPTTAFLLGLMALLVLAAMALHSTLLSLGALCSGWYAWVELAALRSAVEHQPLGTRGVFVLTRLPAGQYYQYALMLGGLLTAGIAWTVLAPKLVALAEKAEKVSDALQGTDKLGILAREALARVPTMLTTKDK